MNFTMTMRRGFLALALLSALSSSGCYSYVVRTTAPQTTAPNTSIGVSWIWGIIGTSATAAECTEGLAYSVTYMPWWSFLISGITAGLIVPMQAEWACTGGGSVQPMVVEVPMPSKGQKPAEK